MGEPGGNGGRPLGVPDDTLNGTDGIKRKELRNRNSRLTICTVCLLFILIFLHFRLAWIMKLDWSVSFQFLQKSVFLPGFLTLVVVYWFRALQGVLESRHTLSLLFFWNSEPKEIVSLILSFVLKKKT